MNSFVLVRDNDDLGDTLVENYFINHYMPSARGDYVKVYIYALKMAQSRRSDMISDKELSKCLSVNEETIEKAFEYWEKQGIINIELYEGSRTINFDCIKSMLLSPKKKKKKKTAKEINKENRILQMNKDIESKLGRTLTHDELMMFLSWIEDYGFSTQTVELIVSDCIARNKKQKRYWDKVALGFYDKGIKTYDEAIDEIEARNDRWSAYSDIFAYLGLNTRGSNITAAEKKLVDKWLDEYNLDIDKIKKAADETTATNKPNFKYLDKIIYNMYIENDSKKKKKVSKQGVSKKTKIDSDDKYENYNDNDLEKALFGDN